MRDKLPVVKSWYCESGVVNIDDSNNEGTHWVAYKKTDDNVQYFHSFGDLSPPIEIVLYSRRGNPKVNIVYNDDRYQNFDSFLCGHLCLKFLRFLRWRLGDITHVQSSPKCIPTRI